MIACWVRCSVAFMWCILVPSADSVVCMKQVPDPVRRRRKTIEIAPQAKTIGENEVARRFFSTSGPQNPPEEFPRGVKISSGVKPSHSTICSPRGNPLPRGTPRGNSSGGPPEERKNRPWPPEEFLGGLGPPRGNYIPGVELTLCLNRMFKLLVPCSTRPFTTSF